jgi:protein involved in polysaccharide export with SLBB domain
MSPPAPKLALLAAVLVFASACHAPPRPLSLPPPVDVAALGPGDVFELHIVGEEKLPTTFTVSPDGSVDLPYVKRLHAAGLEPQQLAALVHRKLAEMQIWNDTSVSVNLKESNSKRVEILGEVARPGSIAMVPGMTLLRAISMSGGFNSMANTGRVTVRRHVAGGTRAATVSAQDIMDNRIPDPALQAGDSVNVEPRLM